MTVRFPHLPLGKKRVREKVIFIYIYINIKLFINILSHFSFLSLLRKVGCGIWTVTCHRHHFCWDYPHYSPHFLRRIRDWQSADQARSPGIRHGESAERGYLAQQIAYKLGITHQWRVFRRPVALRQRDLAQRLQPRQGNGKDGGFRQENQENHRLEQVFSDTY